MGMTATECNFFAVITFEQQNINKQNKKRGPKFAALIPGPTFCSFPRKDLEEPACLRFQGNQEFDGEVARIRQPRRSYSVSEIAHNSAIIPVLTQTFAVVEDVAPGRALVATLRPMVALDLPALPGTGIAPGVDRGCGEACVHDPSRT